MDYCPNFSAVLLATAPDGQKLAVAGRCKKWDCEFCVQKNRAKWAAVLIDYINNSGTSWSWFTLTAHRNAHNSSDPPKYTLMNLRSVWDMLMKRMRRKYGWFEYCRVYEKHKSGAYHIHAIRQNEFDDITVRNRGLPDEYSDSVWLRKTATSIGLGYMTHADNIEREKAGLVAWYVVKYMVKTEGKSWEGVRRIQTSRGIKYTKKSEYNWKLRSGLYMRDLAKSGDGYYLINEKRELTTDDFLDTYAWPPDGK